jgi:tight adherence protein B
VWRVWRGAVVGAVVVGLVLGGPLLGVIGGGVVTGTPFVIAAIARSRAEAAYDSNLAAFLDAVARGVRSGGSLPVAIDEASRSVRGAVAADARRVAVSVSRGRPLPVALDDWVQHRSSGSVRLTAGALALAVDTGGPPARVVEEVAAALRSRQQVDAEARALAAQARLSAMVVGVAPIAFAALTCLTDRRNAHLLFGTPIGVGCVTVGLCLDATGALWMRRISDSVRR